MQSMGMGMGTQDPMSILIQGRNNKGNFTRNSKGNFTRNNKVGKRNSRKHSQRQSRGQERGRGRGRGGRGRGRGGFGGRNKRNNGMMGMQSMMLPTPGRTYIPEIYFTGKVEQFNGKWGFIEPDHPIGHDSFVQRNSGRAGKLFFHSNDVDCDQQDLPKDTQVKFYLYVDQRGLGAHKVTCPQLEAIQGLKFILSIEKSYVGGLIGKKACNIKKLISDTGAQINVQRDHGNTQDYQLCVITGEPDKMISACYAIALQLADVSQSLNAKLQFIIPAEYIGRIIGRKGSNIKALQAKFPSIRTETGRNTDTPIYVDDEPHRTFQCFGPNQDMKKFTEEIGYQLLSFDGYERPAEASVESFTTETSNRNNNNNQDVIEIY